MFKSVKSIKKSFTGKMNDANKKKVKTLAECGVDAR